MTRTHKKINLDSDRHSFIYMNIQVTDRALFKSPLTNDKCFKCHRIKREIESFHIHHLHMFSGSEGFLRVRE